MKKAEAYRETLRVSREVVRHRYRTAQAYAEEAALFVAFCQQHRPPGTNEQRVAAYLSHVAPRISATTQNKKLNAILFFFAKVLEKPLGDLGPWQYAQRPKRIPVWLNQGETRRLLDLMPGTFGLMARVTYGSGLRLMECVRLRIQHVDLEQRTLFILGAKGDKDRVVPLAQSCVAPLAEHMARLRALWQGDQANGLPPVALPDGLERKYPNYGRQWEWFWLWPGRNLSRDPESGTIRRHHVHEDVYSRSLKVAARRAGLGKRVTMHVLRHSFATHFLEQGGSVNVLQKLLGHSHLETTSIYLHCLPQLITGARSPLDDLTPAVIPFPAAGPCTIGAGRSCARA
ncbi:MAG: integron integrase [Opitutaceae bacterium]|nr:integron integrase [Opitutaceae bacterium]